MKNQSMINSQIKARGISDERLLKAMLKVERHLFVPLMQKNFSYEDRPLPIGRGQLWAIRQRQPKAPLPCRSVDASLPGRW